VLSQENYFVEVSLSQGILRGLRIRTAFNRDAFAFMGIPYATPPYNQLRFKV
jgi:carboxylesterase type B